MFVECNVGKLSSPHNYSSNDSDRITNTKLWLERILVKFNTLKKKVTFVEFMETLKHECENKMIFEAWRICGGNLEWHTNWPKLMQLW